MPEPRGPTPSSSSKKPLPGAPWEPGAACGLPKGAPVGSWASSKVAQPPRLLLRECTEEGVVGWPPDDGGAAAPSRPASPNSCCGRGSGGWPSLGCGCGAGLARSNRLPGEAAGPAVTADGRLLPASARPLSPAASNPAASTPPTDAPAALAAGMPPQDCMLNGCSVAPCCSTACSCDSVVAVPSLLATCCIDAARLPRGEAEGVWLGSATEVDTEVVAWKSVPNERRELKAAASGPAWPPLARAVPAHPVSWLVRDVTAANKNTLRGQRAGHNKLYRA